jgi:hypothetical protein
MTQQAPSKIKTHLAHNKQTNKLEENRNGNQDALSHHHQLPKVLSGLLSVVDGVVPSIYDFIPQFLITLGPLGMFQRELYLGLLGTLSDYEENRKREKYQRFRV